MAHRDEQAFAASMSGSEPYVLGPDSLARDGVPQGILSQHHWKSEKVYPGVERDYWLYVPRQYDDTEPACLMVFQDAELYLGPDANVPIVFDNLIHAEQMPVMIGLF